MTVRFLTPSQKEAIAHVFAGIQYRYGIEEKDLMTESRDQTLVRVRQFAWYVLRERYSFTLPGIGEIFGKDHTTVMHGIQVIRTKNLTQTALELLDYPQSPKVIPRQR